MNQNILTVEDDLQIQSFIDYALKHEGYSCITASNGEEAIRKAREENTAIMILDLGLPVIRTVRLESQMPIIVVSARDRESEKIAALDAGADDYLTKPFSATELMARIRVAERHLKNQIRQEDSGASEVRELRIDLNKRLVYLAEKELHVTPMEYQLLEYFFQNIGKVLTTKSIIEVLWGKGYGSDTQALRSLMAGLRRKIEKNPAKPEYIITEIGVGYRLLDQ